MGSNRCIVDWLEFTYHFKGDDLTADIDRRVLDQFMAFSEDFPSLFEDLQISGVKRNRGHLNYDYVYDVAGLYQVYYHTQRPDMGIHVCFPGKAMSVVPILFDLPSLEAPDLVLASQVFEKLYYTKNGRVKLTRFDLAFDDFDKVYSPADYFELQRQHRIRSRCRQAKHYSNFENPEIGSTWYLGVRGSGRFLRIYDKEFESKGQIKSIRYELEIRDRHAEAYARKIMNENSELDFGSLIRTFFEVLDPLPGDPDSYSPGSIPVMKNRLPVNQKWLDMLGTQVSRRVKVYVERAQSVHNAEGLLRYALQFRKSAKLFIDCFGFEDFIDFVQNAVYTESDIKRRNIILREVKDNAYWETARVQKD